MEVFRNDYSLRIGGITVKNHTTRILGKKKNVKKRRVVNANHPPSDVSQEELERFWGEITPADRKWAMALRKRKVKKKIEPSIL